MSIKDYDKVVNIYNGTTGNIVESFDYLDLLDSSEDGFLEFTNFENLSFNRILKKLLENKDNINISIGYKG